MMMLSARGRQALNRVTRPLGSCQWMMPSFIFTMVLSVLFVFFGAQKEVNALVDEAKVEWIPAVMPKGEGALSRRDEVVRSGDTAVAALGRLGFAFADVSAMLDAARKVHPLRDIVAGKQFTRTEESGATHVYYPVDENNKLHLYIDGDAEGSQWKAELVKRAVATRTQTVSGTISDNLFLDAMRAGLDDRTTMNLIDIFSYDIDFARDLQVGDNFRVLYDEQFDEAGKLIGSTILAAEFVNRGEVYKAVRFQTRSGNSDYFSADGKSLRKAFLRSPVKFSRISSVFNLNRKHPILGYTRAHRGVDYAAPMGTPIRSVGDGKVLFAGNKSGYGRLVEIRHSNGNITTAYAHMKGFGSGIRTGAHVRQGEVIGYVGMTGLATGPHLHFEFRVAGQAVNPLSVKRPPANPVPSSEMDTFRSVAAQLLERTHASSPELVWS